MSGEFKAHERELKTAAIWPTRNRHRGPRLRVYVRDADAEASFPDRLDKVRGWRYLGESEPLKGYRFYGFRTYEGRTYRGFHRPGKGKTFRSRMESLDWIVAGWFEVRKEGSA